MFYLKTPNQQPQLLRDGTNVENMKYQKQNVDICHKCFGSGGTREDEIRDPYAVIHSDSSSLLFLDPKPTVSPTSQTTPAPPVIIPNPHTLPPNINVRTYRPSVSPIITPPIQ